MMNALDYNLSNCYDQLYQTRALIIAYMDEWEMLLGQIESDHIREKSKKDFDLLEKYIDQVDMLMATIVKYYRLNPYGSENERLHEQLWKAKQYIRSLGGDWNTVLWTNRKDYL